MSHKEIKRQAFEANRELPRMGLVLYTFGNVSAIDRDRGVFAIKPSGVAYEDLKARDMVVVDLEGVVVEGKLRPSSDTATHALLYQHLTGIGGICHTHSAKATAWCQAARPLPCTGTTHADTVFGEVPVTAFLTKAQTQGHYEKETGHQILAAMKGRKTTDTPMVLVAGHAPFTWGKNAGEAVYHAAVLELMAQMAIDTFLLRPRAKAIPLYLVAKHHQRKHGAKATYGQEPQS